MPPITLWFLQASRCIRTAWLLEELNLDYEVKFSDRNSNRQAPQEFKDACKNPLGKFPTLDDGDLTIYESGAIAEYLCENYDKDHKLIPKDPKARWQVIQWVHAAEATFALHALPITYSRWFMPEEAKQNGTLQTVEEKLSVNVQKDLDWLEKELSQSGTKFLCGNEVTAADTMMHFCFDFISKMKLGTEGKSWANTEKWAKACEDTETYKRAVAKTGHKV